MNRESNFPTAQASRELQKVDGFISDTLGGISAMASMEKPQSEGELKERIKMYFDYCKNNSFRPGVESLSLALGVDRSTFWRWCNRETNVSLEWAKTCKIARQSIVAFTEASAISGHLSPPVAIFILKNIAGYKDSVSFEDATQNNALCNVLIARDLPVLKSEGDENVNL
ncbi:terminase small subunit [Butyrivibrio sp. AE2005]|uniref:terminase small subunit n=1 Tax=Butyrivibrio sp. AE2005 TaxID=1496722 RepID=UPI00047A8A1B|nr:terminase small subunit [Butyrivibrio sp. AE2005]